MTTERFRRLSSATAQAMAAVKSEHCAPPTYRPAQPVNSSMKCRQCGGTLRFTVAASGASTGRCNSINCVRWSE